MSKKQKRLGQVSGNMLAMVLLDHPAHYVRCMAEELIRYRRLLAAYPKLRNKIKGMSVHAINLMNQANNNKDIPLCDNCQKLKQQVAQLKNQLKIEKDVSWLLHPAQRDQSSQE